MLHDALRKIHEMRAHRKAHGKEHAHNEHDDHKIHLDLNIDEETAEELGKHFEEQMESLGESIEEWAKGFEAHVEEWAEEYGEDMEAWAAEFEASWEEWAETQGQQWEEWGEQFGARWEEWGEKLEDGSLTEEDIKQLVEGNVEMLKKMPIEGLYEQLSRSKDQLKDLPWESVEGLEKVVEESVLQGLEGLEALAEADFAVEGEEVSAAVRALHESLQRVQRNLDTKNKELDVARLKALEQLKELELAQRGDMKSLEKELKREKEMLERSRRLLAEAERAASGKQHRRMKEQAELAQRYLEVLKEMDGSVSPELKSKLLMERLHAEQAEHSERDSELAELRAQIAALRAEVESLRAKDD